MSHSSQAPRVHQQRARVIYIYMINGKQLLENLSYLRASYMRGLDGLARRRRKRLRASIIRWCAARAACD